MSTCGSQNVPLEQYQPNVEGAGDESPGESWITGDFSFLSLALEVCLLRVPRGMR